MGAVSIHFVVFVVVLSAVSYFNFRLIKLEGRYRSNWNSEIICIVLTELWPIFT